MLRFEDFFTFFWSPQNLIPDDCIRKIRRELKDNADETTRKIAQRFFKEKIKCHGVKTGIVGKIAKKYWREVKESGKKEIFRLCEELYLGGYCEEAFVVSFWLPNLSEEFEPEDMAVFKRWIEKYIDNWAKCDSFCNHTVGNFIEKYPKYVRELKRWTKSENRWLRRAAAVSLIVPAKKGKFLVEIFGIADKLLRDEDDMVRKGYGWMLKEAGRLHQKEVFDYVMRNKKEMPRTALRYAIELMPKKLKAKAMKKEY